MSNTPVTPPPRSSRHTWRAGARFALQTVVAFAAAAPLIYTAITRNEPEAAVGGAAMVLAVAGALTRLMAVPAVDRFLRRVAPWLVSDRPSTRDAERRQSIDADTTSTADPAEARPTEPR